MPDLPKTITLWGILDLCSVGWYVGWRLLHGQIPFYHDLAKSIESASRFGIPSLSMITAFSLTLYVSLLFSGVYLIRHHKAGAILSYIQAPFRILALIPPSIFFIIWPLKFLFNNPQSVLAISTLLLLLLLSESLKLYCVIGWRKRDLVA
jgi:hypothetical protein